MFERAAIIGTGLIGGSVAAALKRNHDPQRIVAAMLTAEIAEKQARSIRYQMGVAKLPLAKDIDEFAFDGTPINENLVRDLAGGGFVIPWPLPDVTTLARQGLPAGRLDPSRGE